MSIKANKGKSFSVTLRSNLGSTVYGWCLTEMPPEAMLYAQQNIRRAPMSVEQEFHFIVKEKADKNNFELKFSLVDFTNADEVENVIIPVEIEALDSGNAAGNDKFIEFDGNTASYGANKLAIDYAFPAVGYAFDVPMPAVPYGVFPANAGFDASCVGMAYQVMPRSAFQDCPNGMYNMMPRSKF